MPEGARPTDGLQTSRAKLSFATGKRKPITNVKKEAPPEHQKDPPLVTYDAIRERATSESASPPDSDSTKPNGATQKKKKQDVKFQDIIWKRKATKRPSH